MNIRTKLAMFHFGDAVHPLFYPFGFVHISDVANRKMFVRLQLWYPVPLVHCDQCIILVNEYEVTYTKKMNNSQKYEGTKLKDFTPTDTVTELQIIDVFEGTGDVVPEGATITAHYTGALVKNGIIFQSSHDFGRAITFPLSGVIAGWTQGVPGMKVGGMRRLVIPAAMAYGASSPAPNIPANSDLVFDIELVAIER